MQEYEVEVTLIGVVTYSILAESADKAEELTRNRVRDVLSEIDADHVYSGSVATNRGRVDNDDDDDDQLEEEDQWNGTKQ